LDELKERQAALEKESKDIDFEKNELDEKIKELKGLKASLEGPLNMLKDAGREGIQHMIGVYNYMDPQKAAAMLDKMDDTTVIEILKGMKSKKVAQIMSFMNTDRAAKISSELTGAQVKGP
ncbi:MAG: MotE family protein, partial [Dissulfurimicrobium sp.]